MCAVFTQQGERAHPAGSSAPPPLPPRPNWADRHYCYILLTFSVGITAGITLKQAYYPKHNKKANRVCMYVCVGVFPSHLFWTSLYAFRVVVGWRSNRGHTTGGNQHRIFVSSTTSTCCVACLGLYREKGPSHHHPVPSSIYIPIDACIPNELTAFHPPHARTHGWYYNMRYDIIFV